MGLTQPRKHALNYPKMSISYKLSVSFGRSSFKTLCGIGNVPQRI